MKRTWDETRKRDKQVHVIQLGDLIANSYVTAGNKLGNLHNIHDPHI